MAADASCDIWCSTGTSPITQCIRSGSAPALRLMMIMSRRAASLSGDDLQRILSLCTGVGHVHAAQEPDGLTWLQAAAAPPCLMFCCRTPLVDMAAITYLLRSSKPWVTSNVARAKRNKNVVSIAAIREPVRGAASVHALAEAPPGTSAALLSVLIDDVLLHYR
jgi:hypothetical protein